MKKLDFAAIIVVMLIFLLAYLTSQNLIVAGVIAIIFLCYYFLIARKNIFKSKDNNARIHECYNFIYSFLITLSVKDSLDEAFDSASRNASKNLNEYLNEMRDMTAEEKLNYLTKYFHFGIYRMFTKAIALYLEQGGNVLKISESLMQENTRIEQTCLESEKQCAKKGFEFFILWSLGFIVLLFIRFSLSNFYETMLKSKIFFILLIVFFLLFLLSIHIFIKRLSSPIVKEEKINYE